MERKLTRKASAHINHSHLIKKMELFRNLDDSSIKELAEEMVVNSYKTGDIIIEFGKIDDSIHFLIEGTVDVISEFGELVDKMKGPQEWFGEVSFFEKVPRTATIKASTDCISFTLKQPDLQAFMVKHPECQIKIEKSSHQRMQNYLERNVLA